MSFCGHKVSTKFQDFAAATIKWGDLDLFLVYFMTSYLTTYNHSTTWHSEYIQPLNHLTLRIYGTVPSLSWLKKHAIFDHLCF